MLRAAGSKVALLAGLGTAGVAVVGGILWKDIAAQYHLHHLRREPSYLLEIIEEPEGTAERRAVRAFVVKPEGRRALVSAFVNVHVLPPFQWNERRGAMPGPPRRPSLSAVGQLLPLLSGSAVSLPEYPSKKFFFAPRAKAEELRARDESGSLKFQAFFPAESEPYYCFYGEGGTS
jgi:hypothetical protein